MGSVIDFVLQRPRLGCADVLLIEELHELCYPRSEPSSTLWVEVRELSYKTP